MSKLLRNIYLSDNVDHKGYPDVSLPDNQRTGRDAEHAMHLRVIKTGLSAFDDGYLTKHLIYAIVELVIVRLFPELEEKSVTEILAKMK